MRLSRRTQATALLLLVSLQYSFAVLDVALCSKALCYPKVSGGKQGKVIKTCPAGYSLEKDGSGADVCIKRVAKSCPAGTTLNGDKCCGAASATDCMASSDGGCPSGYLATKDCHGLDIAVNATGRRLLSGHPLFKEVNIVGHTIVPNVILPKPAISVNIAEAKKKEQPKFTVNGGGHVPQIILPEPKISFSVPKVPKVGPEIKWEGNPSFMPNIIPVLPEPAITLEVPKDGMPSGMPKVNTHLEQKKVTLDLSQTGPKHTLELNLPSMPDLLGEVNKIPDTEINLPDMPKVIDLSGFGPKKTYNITLPEVKLPKQGSLTIINSGANEPQYLDLTHLGPKHKTGLNIKLPSINTNGAVLNVIMEEDKALKEKDNTIVVPGHKAKTNTIINVPAPEKEWPEKKSKLVVDIATNPKLGEGLAAKLGEASKTVAKYNIKLPDIDLSKKLPAGQDVVVEVKPLIAFNHTLKEKPTVTNVEKRVTVEMKNITIPKLVDDTTILLKPVPMGQLAKHFLPHSLKNATLVGGSGPVPVVTTTTVINMPNKTIPNLPIPKDKIDSSVSIPISMGLAKNSSGPDAVINLAYKEEWTGGNPVLPHPTAGVIKKAEKVIDTIVGAKCFTKCCRQSEGTSCSPVEYEVLTAAPALACEDGFSLDAEAGTCSSGKPQVAACPGGTTKCHIGGKGVCAPDVEGKTGHDVCPVFKALCVKGSWAAKSCGAAA